VAEELRDGVTRAGDRQAEGTQRHPRLGLGARILLAIVVGAAAGAALGERVAVVQPVGDLFIRLLILAAVPLVFVNLLAGLTSLTDLRIFGRLAGKTVIFFLGTTVVALFLGIASMWLVQPGAGMTLPAPVEREVAELPSAMQILLDLIPTNLFAAFVEGNVAQLVVVAVLLGVTTLLIPEGPRDRLRRAYSDLAVLLRKVVDLILIVAPYGIGALMAVAVGRYGALLFGPMARFVAAVWGAHLVMLCVYMALLRFFSEWRPWAFLRAGGAVWATTVSTTSSLASLSVSLEAAERMRFPRAVYSFVLPLGAQINKDGTSILLMGVVLFTAQATGATLAGGEYVTLLLMGLVLSAGSGGIPGGGFVVALILVQSFGLPLELAAIVGGIYRLVDMGNTTINVMGDLVGTAVVTRWLGQEVGTGEDAGLGGEGPTAGVPQRAGPRAAAEVEAGGSVAPETPA
jgi:Na+/H+-dicarboxylate symporter